jgi:hypothetical protein
MYVVKQTFLLVWKQQKKTRFVAVQICSSLPPSRPVRNGEPAEPAESCEYITNKPTGDLYEGNYQGFLC